MSTHSEEVQPARSIKQIALADAPIFPAIARLLSLFQPLTKRSRHFCGVASVCAWRPAESGTRELRVPPPCASDGVGPIFLNADEEVQAPLYRFLSAGRSARSVKLVGGLQERAPSFHAILRIIS